MESKGYIGFETKKKEVINRINSMRYFKDVNEYLEKVKIISRSYQEAINKHTNVYASKMHMPNAQADYDKFTFDEYIKALEGVANEAEDGVENFCRADALNKKIDILLQGDNVDLDEITESAKALINTIGKITFYDNVVKSEIINKSYNNIFRCLQIEALFGKNQILNYIRNQNNNTVINYLELLIYDEINKLHISIKDVADVNLSKIDSNTISKGYLNSNILKQIAQNYFYDLYRRFVLPGEMNMEEFQKKGQEYSKKIEDLENKKRKLNKEYKIIEKQEYREDKIFILIQAAIFGLSMLISQLLLTNKMESRINEVNLDTNEIINQETGHLYKKSVEEYNPIINAYSPWKETDNGYIRSVTQYRYNKAIKFDSEVDFNFEDIKNDLEKVGSYEETKSVLDYDENTEDALITIELENYGKVTIDTRGLYNVGGLVVGAMLSLLWVGFLFIFDMDLKTIASIFPSFKNNTISIKSEEDYYLAMKEIEASLCRLKEEYKELKEKYGLLASDIIDKPNKSK